MNNKIMVRIATKQDAPLIALLGRITFTETFGHFFRYKNDLLEYYDQTFSVTKIKKGLENSDNIFWLAFVNELPVAYAKLKLNSKSAFSQSENICQLQKIYVLSNFISMKIGFKLQSILIDKAKENQFDEIWLSVLESNDRAIRFYEKNDFKSVGNHNFQIGKENFEFIAMSKRLK